MILATLVMSGFLGAQGVHRDDQRGFSIRPPAGWTPIPIKSSEKWVVTKYLSDKEYRDKKEGYTHRPDMKVVLFPDAVTENRGGKVTKKGSTIILQANNPFKDFDAYLKANAQGGFFRADRGEKTNITVNGIKVTCKHYKFEKLTAQRIGIAWIFEGRDAKWAVYFEGLEDHIKKLEPKFTKSQKSFKFIRRKGSILEGRTSSDNDIVIEIEDPTDKKKDTPAEKIQKRSDKFDREVRRASSALTKGWTIQKTKNFVAFTHVDKKYTTKVLKRCEAVRKWMEKNFKFLKTGQAGRTIVRICDSSAEERSFSESGGFSFGGGFEIVTHKPEGGMGEWEGQWVNKAVVRKWFADKNQSLAWGMPSWLDTGLQEVLGSAELKGSGLRMKPSIWEKTTLRELANDGKLVKPRKFLSAGWQEFYKVDSASSQAGTFMRFLLNGPKGKTKGFIENYMNSILAIAAEEETKAEAERKAKDGEVKKKMTEEEEEAAEEARFKARNGKKDERLKHIFDRAFGTWSEKKWKKFESSYMSFAK